LLGRDDDRIKFVEHQGKRILAAGFFAFQPHEMQLLPSMWRVTVARQRARVGSDAGRTSPALLWITPCTKIKEVLTARPAFLKKTAW